MPRGTRETVVHLEDRQLAKRLLHGDERAFSRFFDAQFPRLFRFAQARLREDPEVVGEIVTQALSKDLRNIGSYRGESALFTWLCTILPSIGILWTF